MAGTQRRWLRTLLWWTAALVAIIAGGEMIFLVLVEAGDLLVEATQALLMPIFERGLGLPYARAQGLAAWTSLGLLVLIALFVLWRLMPWVKTRIAAVRGYCGDAKSAAADRWRAARWYQKLLVVTGGVFLVFGLAMVI